MTHLKKWKILSSKLVLNHYWCKVRQDIIQLPNGKIIDDYFVNVRPEIVLILPITQDDRIVFVRQYRHGVEEILLELPAGSFDGETEDALSAAKRELEEETGYTSFQFIPLVTLYDNPVKDTNKIHTFIALNASPSGQQTLDVTEDIEVVLIPLAEIREKIKAKEICVAGSLATLYLGLDFLNFL